MKLRFHLCALILAAAMPLAAQVTGTISGFVTDPSGAAVASAKVTATLVQQQTQRSVEANEEGFYTFNALAPGEYTITAERPGFERLVRSGVVLTTNQNLRVDFALKVGQVSEEVT